MMKKTYIKPVLEVTTVAGEYQLCAGSGDAASFGSPDGDYFHEGSDDDPIEIGDDDGGKNAYSKELDLWDISAFSVWN